MEKFDTIIIGLGAMGSATAYSLSQQQKVLGLEQFTLAHTFGSSHGETRAIREAYFEDPVYVPMVQRAYHNWFALEKKAQTSLLKQVGGLMIGSPQGIVVQGSEKSAVEHNLPYERIDSSTIKNRFPFFNPDENMIGIWEPRAGILLVEKCISTYLELAKEQGAKLNFSEKALSWGASGNDITVTTTRNSYSAKNLVLTAGAWLGDLFPFIKQHLTIERQVQLWFESEKKCENCPVNIWEYKPGYFFYSLPDVGGGVKVSLHHNGQHTTANSINREVCQNEDVTPVQDLIRTYLPYINPQVIRSSVCMYTNTVDGHFLLDHHPQHNNVWIVSPCSGHGFKFSSVIGEIVTSLVTTGESPFPLERFSLRRLLS
ncbi:N-methyl-L-tryptophan oxidase [Candidatus Uabimicrobium sp. HlEnr_7]|uniref:N-methyl-L-tryptophan oxidase n=1 Tax=Candidatus Uabimicrobium helgolandensis TaxID=3095367 RepID=UPI0035583A9A